MGLPRAPWPALALALAGTLAAGCATYSDRHADLRPALARADYDGALAQIASVGDKDRLLRQLETGLVLHYAGRWQESNEAFAAAELIADDLYTRSVSEGVLSLFTNDASISYRARPFELAMVPYYRALNYVSLGLRTDAVVEGRKASQLLARTVDATLAAVEGPPRDAYEATKNDAFLLHFSAMLYEWGGETNDAFVAYRNAATAYERNGPLLGLEIPPSLAGDLERTGRRLGFAAELARLREVCPAVWTAADSTATGPGRGRGEVVLFLESGFVPAREQVRLDVPILKSERGTDPDDLARRVRGRHRGRHAAPSHDEIAYWLSLALPQLPAPVAPPAEAVVLAGGVSAHPARVADLAALAAVTFEAEYDNVLLKTVARAAAKYVGTVQAEKAGGEVVGLLGNLLFSVTETADTRSWLTLPRSIHLARLSLAPGTHTVRATVDDGCGHVWDVTLPDVEVREGGWTFLSQRVF